MKQPVACTRALLPYIGHARQVEPAQPSYTFDGNLRGSAVLTGVQCMGSESSKLEVFGNNLPAPNAELGGPCVLDAQKGFRSSATRGV